MLHWVNRFNICAFLDNHQYGSSHQTVECLAAAGACQVFSATENIFPQFSSFLANQNDWLFGHVNYDLKNEIDPLFSNHPDHIGFPDIIFFQPEIVLQLEQDRLCISSLTQDPASVFAEMTGLSIPGAHELSTIKLTPRIEKADYLEIIQKLKEHIRRGDCYEINFCQEFYAEEVSINPLQVYTALTRLSPNPFSCFYKLHQRYLLCASPERYLQKKNNRILSQPIKGTYPRNLTDAKADHELKTFLSNSEKDKSENVMVVDLVRNDLSRICREGSVKVEELFGIYSFPQVHQMISTISGELEAGMDLSRIIQASFPMGSMTGAPKRSVMELIEKYEKTKRGIYSGAVGYIRPDGDFDFNVVIRSILYHATNQYLCCLVGGGITFYSDPEQEYAECLLKAAAIRKVLEDPD
ncbi:MAG: anthranilate synthase component I family protein [Bacteroidota bacterium]|nr:anthranilate synthase component I family protein [Bacteroidota bacterium]